MALKLVIVMDPIDRIDIHADSTFAIMREAQKRGHELFYAETRDLELDMQRAFVTARPVEIREVLGDHYTLGAAVKLALDEVDSVFMRKDPPVDVEYFVSTYVLSYVDPKRVVMINDPQALRDCNEKLFALKFSEFLPPTIVARSQARIREFIDQHEEIVVKPLTGAGGAGIIHLRRDDKNISSILELMTDHGRVAIMAQRYLAAVTEGDRRIVLIGGKPAGVINRRPKANELRSNMHAGGTPEPAKLDARDLEICAAIGPELDRRGLVFVGIDVIGGYLTEINVTSPTGIQEINRFDGANLEGMLMDWVEQQVAKLRGAAE